MIHHVFANKSNIGDWLSALGIQRLLSHAAVTEHLCDEPFVSATMAKLAAASSDDFVIIGGGGLFMDYFVPFWEGLLTISQNIPFGIWGVGYCDLKLEPSRPPFGFLSEIISRSRFCYVRDALTREHLAECNLPPPTGCPSLFALECTTNQGFGLLHVDNYTTAGAEVYETMDAIGARFAQDTRRPFRRTNNRIQSGSTTELRRLLNLYHQSDLVLSSALHGCIIGLAMGKRVVAVSGDLKIESFMAAAGLRNWVCDTTEVNNVAKLLRLAELQPSASSYLDATRNANLRIAAQVTALSGHSVHSKTNGLV